MRDPDEGVSAHGTIVTGAARDRVPAVFEPVLAAGIEQLGRRAGAASAASLQLYGSVATGQARVPSSDVDLLVLGLSSDEAAAMSARLTARFGDRCRSVDVGHVAPGHLTGEDDEAYGNRVFLRHYCVPLAGSDPVDRSVDFPADARAARGFNGDIGLHLARWRRDVVAGEDPAELARRVARKTLFPVAGLVSVYDGTWTTDRVFAATRWAQVEPALAGGLDRMVGWIDGAPDATRRQVEGLLDGPVAAIVDAFEEMIGLWR